MSIALTSDQVLALAPDASSASAGKKLGNTKTWKNLGQSSEALWGECQGSALYQVKIDLSSLTTQCSCPSRKFPCKHSLALMWMRAEGKAAFASGTPPQWVNDWVSRRRGPSQAAPAADAASAGVVVCP